MNDLLLTVGAISLAVAIAMVFTVWRIRRLQYPPELRWPDERTQRKSRRHRRQTPPPD